ncbi:MAG: CP12 domain-containing protein [Cyanobacteria bacterium P01_D01_bin.156]
MTNTTIAAVTASSSNTQQLSSQSALETQLKAALEHARRLTEMHGTQSIDTAIAWEAVEELEKAQNSHQRSNPTVSFACYCEENPDALEARMYDV